MTIKTHLMGFGSRSFSHRFHISSHCFHLALASTAYADNWDCGEPEGFSSWVKPANLQTPFSAPRAATTAFVPQFVVTEEQSPCHALWVEYSCGYTRQVSWAAVVTCCVSMNSTSVIVWNVLEPNLVLLSCQRNVKETIAVSFSLKSLFIPKIYDILYKPLQCLMWLL